MKILNFLRKTALADPIFTLGEGIQLFWAAFDPTLAVAPLKVALGWEKIDFYAFQKNNHTSVCQMSFFQLFF